MPTTTEPSLTIAVTPGEPAGIGPDLAVLVAQKQWPCRLVFVADPELLGTRARALNKPLTVREWSGAPPRGGVADVVAVTAAQPVVPGRLDAANAPYVLATLERAVEGCRRGEFDALVTGPVQKSIINEAGIPFTGHTEFLAERTATEQVVMMLTADSLRVALATTHLALSQVCRHITRAGLERTLRILHADLRQKWGIDNPRILVCGLNPHAGESGHLGREEIEIITPVLDALRAEGMALAGPAPADTAFTPPALAGADAVLAMYHDQGLPVLKHHGFGHAVNVTLGLPIIRTSVDHGTALDLAGTGDIDTGSMEAAINTAIEMATARRD